MKTETLVARVTPELAKKVVDAAKAAGEAEAVIIRDALREYFSRREPGDSDTMREAPDGPNTPVVPAAQTDTTYLKRKRMKKP